MHHKPDARTLKQFCRLHDKLSSCFRQEPPPENDRNLFIFFYRGIKENLLPVHAGPRAETFGARYFERRAKKIDLALRFEHDQMSVRARKKILQPIIPIFERMPRHEPARKYQPLDRRPEPIIDDPLPPQQPQPNAQPRAVIADKGAVSVSAVGT